MHTYYFFGLRVTTDFLLDGVDEIPAESFDLKVNVEYGFPKAKFLSALKEASYKEGILEAPFFDLGKAVFVPPKKLISIRLIAEDSNLNLTRAIACTVARYQSLSGALHFHASCVVDRAKAILFIGEGGSGKSTIALKALTEGWNVLSDDSSVLSKDPNGRFVCHASGIGISVLKESLPFLNSPESEIITTGRKSEIKYKIESYQALPVAALVFLKERLPSSEISSISPKEAFSYSLDHLRDVGFLKLGIANDMYSYLGELLSSVPGFTLSPPDGIDNLYSTLKDLFARVAISEQINNAIRV